MDSMSKKFKTLLNGGFVLLWSLVVIRPVGTQICIQSPQGITAGGQGMGMPRTSSARGMSYWATMRPQNRVLLMEHLSSMAMEISLRFHITRR